MGMTVPGAGSTRRRRRDGHAPMAEINVTPLVDVMLVLLIIFMVTAPLLTAAVPIDLPDSQAKPLEARPEAVTVSIERSGQVYIDKDALAPGELPDRIAALAGAGNKPPLVTLRADRGLDYGRVMAVMGELNAAGITQISLVTTGGSGGGGGAPVSGGSAGRP